MTSTYYLRRNENLGPHLDINHEFLALQLKYSPKAFDNRIWNSPPEEGPHDLLEVGAGVLPGFCPRPSRVQDGSTKDPWKMQDDSTEGPWNPLRIDNGKTPPTKNRDPWDQLRIQEGEILPIMNLDPFNAIYSEKQKDSSDCCSTAANENRDFAAAKESGVGSGNAFLTHMLPSRWNTMGMATTTTDTTEYTGHWHDGVDKNKPGESAKGRRDLRTHEISHSQTDTSQAALSSQSESTSTSLSQSPYDSFDLSIAQAKHDLMVTLMKEFYAIFDSRWKVSVQTCASSQQESSEVRPQSSKTEVPRVGKNSRKRKKDRDSSPPGDGNGRREKKDDSDSRLHHPSRPYACPFHKYDPYKYSLNDDTGAAYRSCPSHGSNSIAHLK